MSQVANSTILNNRMDIVFCIDDNYIMPCGVTIISLLENHKDNMVTFHTVGLELKEESKKKLSSVCSRYRNASILFYDVSKESLDSYELSLQNSRHLSLATYARLFIENMLPHDVDKVLYLDCDLIVVNNLSELWNTDIDGYAIAGVPDFYICSSRPDTFQRLDYSSVKGYVNAGVLLINLKYWREKKLINVFLSFIKEKYDYLAFHDQDVINGTLYDSKLFLPIRFNILNSYYMSVNNDINGHEDEVYEALADPAIIHYTSPEKPWLRLSMHPLNREFIKYKKLSPWKDEALAWPNISLSRKFRYYKRKVLYALGLKKPKYMDVRKDSGTGKYNIKKGKTWITIK